MVKVLDREKIKRMTGAGSGVVGSSGGGDVDLSGYATQIWTTENFVSIEYFRTLFKAFDSNDDEIVPNNTTSVVDNIKAMVGLWTEQYLTALGNQSGGGGGGGGAQYLNDLLDVQLTTPLTDGQALVYNATLQKWVNGAAGVNMTTVWNALAGSTNEQINASHLSTALSGYVTTSDISDMATQTWVGQQGFATQTWVTSNFITIAYFDRLFRAYNGSTLVSHNDTTTTIDNIKAMFGFWTDFYLSALGTGGVSSVSISLSQLADVNVAGVTNGQVLSYNSTNAEWVPTTISNVTSLSALSDVQLTAPSINQVMTYNSITGKWENSDLKTVNGQSIIGTGDIPVSGGGGSTMSYIIPFATAQNADTIKTQSLTTNFRFGTTNTGSDTWLNIIDIYKQTTFIDIPWTDPRYGAQMFFGINNGQNNVGVRFRYDGSWGSIYKLAYTSDLSNYLPLTGGKMSGNIYISNSNPAVFFSANGNDWCVQEYNTKFYFGNGIYYSMIMNTAGHIGIGGEEPSLGYDLVSKGDMYCKGTLLARAFNAAYVEIPAGQNIIQSTSGYDLYVNFSRNDNVLLCIGGGNVGIGVSTISYKLQVAGSIYATGGVTALSDIRHKTVIRDAAVSVEDIARMPAVMYQWNDGREDKKLHVGSIAQNWQTVLPEVVLKANDEEGTLSMQYGVAALVSSIIIARKVVNHEERIKQLEKENKELKKRLNIA